MASRRPSGAGGQSSCSAIGDDQRERNGRDPGGGGADGTLQLIDMSHFHQDRSPLSPLIPAPTVLALYGATGFAGAGLLFAVEPMISKMALPRLGGTPAVWTTCLLFFQAVLLLGYGYAYALVRWFDRRWQIGVHLALLAAVSIALPPTFTTEGMTPGQAPALWLLARLTVTVGPPFFAIAATAPLLQHWFSRIGHRDSADPYFLYAASNLGSLLALIAYPFVIEPNLPLDRQSELWARAFGVFALGMVFGAIIYLARSRPAEPSEPHPCALTQRANSGRERLRWVALAFVPSSLLLGFTTHITTDIVATPLFWVLPLALYLLTFALAFARRPPLRHAVMLRLLPITLIPLVLFGPWLPVLPLVLMLVLNLGCFFVIAMVCHGELARQRPYVGRLTEFYFCLSLGGVLGGIFNAILAPLLFPEIWEFPLVLILACLLLPWSRGHRRFALAYDLLSPLVLFVFLIAVRRLPVPHWPPVLLSAALFLAYAAAAATLMSFRDRPPRFALGVAVCVVVPALAANSPAQKATWRDFFGVYRVIDIDDGRARILTHGTTVHGAASLLSGEETLPSGYYSREGPFGRFFNALNSRRHKAEEVGIIGLGTGALGCYARPDQHWTFFEIDPLVERIARQFFKFMIRCGNNPRVALGDARLTLAGAVGGPYDALVIDAFSSDNIPMHLLTREAFALYFNKLAPEGVLLFHISNRYLNLEPVIAAVASSFGAQARRLAYRPPTGTPYWRSSGANVVAVAAPGANLDFLAPDAGWSVPPRPPAYALWTDQRSDLLRTIRWLR
jgi:hypothetical protein